MTRHRREYFRIRQVRRIYDRARNRFQVNIAYETAAEVTSRTVAVAEGFGLGVDQQQKFVIYDDAILNISPTDIVLITGDSGSGKSVLLRTLKKDLGNEVIDAADVNVQAERPLIETIGATVEEGLELLSKAGLGDAFLFIRPFSQLSDGQRYRYRMAKMIESETQWWLADEFCATLDRDTAKILAFNVQKVARSLGKGVIVATTHNDLLEDLQPTVHVHKRFGKEIHIFYLEFDPRRECSLMKEMRVEEGGMQDWHALEGFHYRSHRISAPRKIFRLMRGEELCGVIVYTYPCPAAFGRRKVMPRMDMRQTNRELSTVSRVVIHPKYRMMGLGVKLVRETLERCGTPCVEMSAVMAKYNPFAEKAGMTKIAVQNGAREAVKIGEILQDLSFNLELLGSRSYVAEKLKVLRPEEIEKVRAALIRYPHLRLKKSFQSHMPYGTKASFEKGIKEADLERLAILLKTVGFLLQTKVYLFWSKLGIRKQ